MFLELLILYGSFESSQYLQNTLPRSAHIFHYRARHSENFHFSTFFRPPKFHRHLTFHIRSELQTKPYPHQETDLDLKFLVLSSNPKNLRSRTVFSSKKEASGSHLGDLWSPGSSQGDLSHLGSFY